ncbi:hypothetical protein QEH56_20740 [Pelagicoccus enzymogenes]|uniref:hypothetical protein n=1 Tax=Pelagicoccus enzymogenes TaxID=2773457 RepID=UPI0028102C5A|nr:hypothetical protein [Pelagicoccus enzymogenes]MDQ8200606.1 hypothetical protein [Pelagicoccus enzymogenes]
MKTSIYRLLINWYQASDKKLPAWLERACQNDPSLSDEKSFGDELTRELRSRPEAFDSMGGESMTSRVLRQIAEEDYEESQDSQASPVFGAWVRNAGLAMAALAVAFAGYRFLDTKSEIADGGEIAVVTPDQTATDGLLEIAEDWKNPLDQEIEYIVSDAKGALGFLANNFVPSSYLKEEA